MITFGCACFGCTRFCPTLSYQFLSVYYDRVRAVVLQYKPLSLSQVRACPLPPLRLQVCSTTLKDPKASVREKSVGILGGLGHAALPFLDELTDLLADEDESPQTAGAAGPTEETESR